jgi:transcriptional regulator of arginine metabolism
MKTDRHKKILEIINKQVIETQEELADRLQQKGYKITQATVSRDIKELRLVKVATGDDKYRYAVQGDKYLMGGQNKNRRIFKDSVVALNYSENLIVVKTTPGAAQSVALVIDNEGFREIIGTVAGDDTVMVVVKPKSAVKQIINKFESYIY